MPEKETLERADSLEAALRPSRLSACDVARERFADNALGLRK